MTEGVVEAVDLVAEDARFIAEDIGVASGQCPQTPNARPVNREALFDPSGANPPQVA